MQKTNKPLAVIAMAVVLLLSGGSSIAQTSPAPSAVTADSIVTVQQLIKIDNAQAREKANSEIDSAGLNSQKSGTPVKVAPVLATMTVQSISGLNSDMKADITFTGVPRKGVRKGDVVSGCTVESIIGKCVALKPIDHGKLKSVKSDQCPSACWTGVQAAPNDAALGLGSQQRTPLPTGLGTGPLPTGQGSLAPLQTAPAMPGPAIQNSSK